MTDRSRPASARAEPQLKRLFDDLARGRPEALADLFRSCSDELYGLALWRTGSRADAGDVVQEVFVLLARAGQRLPHVRDPRAYLRRMAHRVASDLQRRRSRRPEQPLTDCEFLEAPTESLERRLDAERVSRQLGTLPPAQREVIYLRHFAGCSFAEIGRATGVPTFTAASRYRLGMRRLKQRLGVEA